MSDADVMSERRLQIFLTFANSLEIYAPHTLCGEYVYGKLVEITLNSKKPEGVMIPGHLWHGTKNIGTDTSETIYFITYLLNKLNVKEFRNEILGTALPLRI